MKEISGLLRKVIRLQREKGLIGKGERLLLAFSGGVDSVVLCEALVELRGFFGFERLALAHFNHRIRGEEAERDEKFSVSFARDRGLEIFVGREEVRRISEQTGGNLEDTARKLRYNFLRRVKEEEGFTLIATAHHLNDLVETILIWLTRGTGLEGLTGFEPKEGDVVRPLYTVTREEILHFANTKGLKWVEDSSNYDLSLYRNSVRHRIIPLMKELNPALEETFLRMREILSSENRFMDSIATEVLSKAMVSEDKLLVRVLQSADVSIQRRVISKWLNLTDFRKVELVRRLLFKGGKVHLGKGKTIIRRGRYIYLRKES